MKKVLVVMIVLVAVIVPSLTYGQDEPVVYNDDPQMTARLDRVAFVVNLGVQKLQSENSKYWQGRFRFYVWDEEKVNACAYPDGRIFVSRGMMVATQGKDDELISGLNHEAIHIIQKHGRNQAKKGTILGILALAAKAALKLGDDSLGNTALQVGAAAGRARYSREDEQRADKGSVDLCVIEGVDPYAPSRLMQKLQDKYGSSSGFLAGHPATAKRVKFLTDEAKKYTSAQSTSVGRVGAVQAAPAPKPVFLGGVAVIVRDNANGGGFGWGSYGSSETAVKTTLEDALVKTERFTIVDQQGREDAWQEQDLGDTGRMDPETVPHKGKTVGAKWFIYVTLNYYQVTQQGNVNVGNWNNRANVHLVKAEIKGKVKLEPVEKSVAVYSTDFRGSEIGCEAEASASSNWSSGIDLNWQAQPAGKAVESACQKVVGGLISYIDSQIQPAVQPATQQAPLAVGTIVQPQPDPEKVMTDFTLHIQPSPLEGEVEEVVMTIKDAPYESARADYIQLLFKDHGQNVTVAKINIKQVLGTEIWGQIESPNLLSQVDFTKAKSSIFWKKGPRQFGQ